MYYRYEVRRENGCWMGVFQMLNPSQKRKIGRMLHDPKWYANHPNCNTRCWFTEKGFEKFKGIVDAAIAELPWKAEVRILRKESLKKIAMRGTIQCIELL
ncbi:MAG: hypothetical protein RR415_13400 [Ruthenibacterium sp.]